MENDVIVSIKLFYSFLYPFAVLFVSGFVLYSSRAYRQTRFFAVAFAVLLVGAIYGGFFGIRELLFGVAKPEPYFPVVDHLLDTLFLVLILYALMRVVWRQHLDSVNLFLLADLVATGLLAFFIGRGYISVWQEGMRFGGYWGDHVFEVYHAVLILFAIYLLVPVGWRSRSTGTVLMGGGFALLFVSHLNHLYNLLTASNQSVLWFLLEHVFSLMFVFMLGVGLVMKGEGGESFLGRFESEVDLVESLKKRIMDLEELHRRLSESESKYRTLVETMNEGVIVIGGKGRINYCNRFFSEFLGFETDEVIGKPVSEFLRSPVDFKPYNTFEVEWKRKGGGSRPSVVSTSLYRAGGTTGILCTISDLTATRYYQMREEWKTILSDVVPILLKSAPVQRRQAVIRQLSTRVEKLVTEKLPEQPESLRQVGETACSIMNEIGGDFTLRETSNGGLEVINTRCPWGENVHHTYCMLTRSIFTRIFSRYARVVVEMEKTLGNRDECCKLVIKNISK